MKKWSDRARFSPLTVMTFSITHDDVLMGLRAGTSAESAAVETRRLVGQSRLVGAHDVPGEVEARGSALRRGDAVPLPAGLAQRRVVTSGVHHQAVVHQVRVDGAADTDQKNQPSDTSAGYLAVAVEKKPKGSEGRGAGFSCAV